MRGAYSFEYATYISGQLFLFFFIRINGAGRAKLLTKITVQARPGDDRGINRQVDTIHRAVVHAEPAFGIQAFFTVKLNNLPESHFLQKSGVLLRNRRVNLGRFFGNQAGIPGVYLLAA